MDNKVVETRRIVESAAVAGLLKQRKQERLDRAAGKKRKNPLAKDSSYVSFDEKEIEKKDKEVEVPTTKETSNIELDAKTISNTQADTEIPVRKPWWSWIYKYIQ